MELLVIILNQEQYLEDILSILTELGVEGATVIESEGMTHLLARHVPIFAGLSDLLGEAKAQNWIIFALIFFPDSFMRLEKLLLEEQIDFSKPGTGIMFTVPVTNFIGTSAG